MPNKPLALVTNDDGIDSHFFYKLVEALRPKFDVVAAAPATEQSWIGRAVSRRAEVTVEKCEDVFAADVPAWRIGGTPTDCVNIALGHLTTRRPDIVVSGINIGFNTTETLILSSGTVAGAIEGALWNLPAIAFSQSVPAELFAQISRSRGRETGPMTDTLAAAAAKASELAAATLASPPPNDAVVNVNFPPTTDAETPVEDTYPAKIQLRGLYGKNENGTYSFRYCDGQLLDTHPNTDRAALERGSISRSVLDFSRIGVRP